MEILAMILYLLAAICFGIAAFNAAAVRRVDLVAAGLLLWLLPTLIASIAKL